jgi:hypothetical protein
MAAMAAPELKVNGRAIVEFCYTAVNRIAPAQVYAGNHRRIIMKPANFFYAALAIAMLAAVLSGCQRHEAGSAEQAGRKIDEAAQQANAELKQAGTELKQAGAELKDAAHEAGKELKQAAAITRDKINEATEVAGEKLEKTGEKMQESAREARQESKK